MEMNLLAIVIAVCLEVERKHRIKLSGFENERSRVLAKKFRSLSSPAVESAKRQVHGKMRMHGGGRRGCATFE